MQIHFIRSANRCITLSFCACFLCHSWQLDKVWTAYLKNKNTVKLSKSFFVYFHVELLERYRWFCVTFHMLEWLSFCLFWNIDLQCIKFNCDHWHIRMLWTFFNRLSNSWWREDWQTWSGNFYSFGYSWRASWSGRISKARWIL